MIRSMNGRGAEVKARVEGKDRGARMRSQGIGSCKELQKFKLLHHFRSRNASAAGRGRGGGPGGSRSNRAAKQQARLAKLARNYEVSFPPICIYPCTWSIGHLFMLAQDEEWRTVYVGFVERGTTEQELADHFKVNWKPCP